MDKRELLVIIEQLRPDLCADGTTYRARVYGRVLDDFVKELKEYPDTIHYGVEQFERVLAFLALEAGNGTLYPELQEYMKSAYPLDAVSYDSLEDMLTFELLYFFFATDRRGDLEVELLKYMTPLNQPLVCLYLEEDHCETPEELYHNELLNHSYDGVVKDYEGSYETGVIPDSTEIMNRSGVWDYWFLESTDLFAREQGYALWFYIRYKAVDPEEILAWTLMLSWYGGQDIDYPYTLYKGIISGRFETYLQQRPADREFFSKRYDI